MQRFDPAGATVRLVDSLGPLALERAEAYTRSSNLLLVAGAAIWVAAAWAIARWGVLDRLAERWSRRPLWLTTFSVAAVFFILVDLIRLPWIVLADWWHKRSYGLTSQPLADFLGQAELGSIAEAVISGVVIAILFGVIRRSPRRWWVPAGGLTTLSILVMLLLGPTLIQAMFNRYQPVPPGPARVELERVADQTGIPHDRIFMYDGSRQSHSFSANVSGVGSSARIAISDVALKRATIPEIRVIVAHEAGHYMLGHIWQLVLVLPLLAVLALAIADHLYPRVARWFGSAAPLGHPASIAVFAALIQVLAVILSPIPNTITRLSETAADRYALAATNEPDALASALLKTAEYRYPRPSLFEEALFYDHPSLERRIRMAMEWKAAHLPAAGAQSTTAP
jgi:STE24 endopeptidase